MKLILLSIAIVLLVFAFLITYGDPEKRLSALIFCLTATLLLCALAYVSGFKIASGKALPVFKLKKYTAYSVLEITEEGQACYLLLRQQSNNQIILTTISKPKKDLDFKVGSQVQLGAPYCCLNVIAANQN
jgi:hypothetical protein